MSRKFVKAASTDAMLQAFEAKLDQLESQEGIESATTLDMLDAFQSKIDELQGVDTSTDMSADLCNKYIEECDMNDQVVESSDRMSALAKELYDIQVDPGDESVIYEDVDGMFTGEPGSRVSLAEMKRYWDMNYDNDPVLNEEYAEEEGAKWLKETLTWMRPVESCDTIQAARDDDYFGETEARLYGDLIQEELGGRTVSKRKAKAEEPGGLIYEAKQLGIDDFWDLLEALEGMCYEGKAREIDDSTYEILPKGSEQPIEGADNSDEIYMLMSYSSDAEAGMDGDDFTCMGKFFAPSHEAAVEDLEKARKKYPHILGDKEQKGHYSSYYIENYNDYFDDGSEVFSDLDMLVDDIVKSYEGDDRDLAYEDEDTPYN